MDKIKIAILDDHQIVIDGLKLLLNSSPEMNVILTAINGFELLETLRQKNTKPDILLLDLMMPVIGGYEFSLMIKKEFPSVKIIILSMNNDGLTVYNLIENADIKGFLPKSVDRKELISAIEKVNAGNQHFSVEIIDELEKYASFTKEKEALRLTSRELEVISLIAKGYTTKQIASELFLSEKTIETHRKNILRKTDTYNVGSLLEKVNRMGLLL